MPGSILENPYAPNPPPKAHLTAAPLLTPIEASLKSGTPITLYPLTPAATQSLPEGLIRHIHAEFSAEIERGCTYPIEEPIGFEDFRESWFGTFAVVALLGDAEVSSRVLKGGEVDWERACVGTFYIKPNYPGTSLFL
jgi:hypothetical protein